MVAVRPLTPADEVWAGQLLDRRMNGRRQARQGELLDALAFPGFAASGADGPCGLVTYRSDGDVWELFCIVADHPGQGVGTALVDALVAAARRAGVKRVWLITTNDNLRALRFYQRRGFRLSALHPGAVERARAVKPTIPRAGHDGIPLRDELELELELLPNALRRT